MTKRTDSQNNALHLYCELMAEGLNDHGHSVQAVCKVPISWTKDNFKENIWKPVQKAMFPEVVSTTQLSRSQVSEVYEEVNRLISEWGVSMPFPSE